MMNVKFKNIVLAIFSLFFIACSSDDKPTFIEPAKPDMSGFAKGADVGWLTEMEKSEVKFYNNAGVEKEGIELLRSLGMNSIRLRVWVNPVDGWNNADDVLIKAWRAKQLGMRVMIDFHYSDSWADPGQQNKPEAWTNLNIEELKDAISTHTKDVLNKLKDKNIDVEWIQVGNETSNGMLWDEGKASENMKNYAELNNAGYDAAKTVYPQAKIIVHLDRGDNNALYRWMFDGFKNNGGKWDVIGMSLYPKIDTWKETNELCLANIKDVINRYQTEVMICEVGMPWDNAEVAKEFLTDLITKTKAIENNKCLGVFYWEPLAHNSWKEYTLGAFDNSGQPTIALDAFK